MIYKENIIGKNNQTTLTTYILDNYKEEQKRLIVVICPGGGFLNCSPTEGECVAVHFNRAGYHAAVLVYSTEASAKGKCAYPQPLLDLAESICLIREQGEEWNVDKDKIIILGFSAGAHLCASYSGVWNTPLLGQRKDVELRRPNAAVLCYPLVDMNQYMLDIKMMLQETVNLQNVTGVKEKALEMEEFIRSSQTALFGHYPPAQEEIDEWNPIAHITEAHPPAFIWHTFEDRLTSPMQSIHYAEALYKAGVSCELHVFEKGEHGISLADRTSAKKEKGIDMHIAHWSELAVEWLYRKLN